MHSTASRRRAWRKSRSRSARARMVSLKSWVRGMIGLLFLPSFISGPAFLRRGDVFLLPFLRATADENDKAIAVLAEVDTVAGSEVDPAFINARADALGIREIPCSIRVSVMVTLAAAAASS